MLTMKSESVFASGARRAQGMEDQLPAAMDRRSCRRSASSRGPWKVAFAGIKAISTVKPAFFLPETGIKRAFAAITPNLECCQAIVFMI
jgi:hypothetical protein